MSRGFDENLFDYLGIFTVLTVFLITLFIYSVEPHDAPMTTNREDKLQEQILDLGDTLGSVNDENKLLREAVQQMCKMSQDAPDIESGWCGLLCGACPLTPWKKKNSH